MHKLIRAAIVTTTALTVAAGLAACSGNSGSGNSTAGGGDSGAPSVVLSNAYIGNSWRQSMVNTFKEAAEQAKDSGLISSFKVSNAPGENSATDQIAQLKSILLEKPDILLIDPASPTALTPTIKQACNQGITVVVFDSGIKSDCAYVVTNSFPEWATKSTESVINAMGGSGNLLISRGVVGSDPEAQFYAAQQKVIGQYPQVKVVGEINGYCDSATAQKALAGVIASLPTVNGVAGCGDGYGIAQAFKDAGRPIPAVTFETSGRALNFWANNQVATGSIAMMSDPGQSVAALYVALALHKGEKVPQTVITPSVLITQEDRDKWINVVGDDVIASWPWTQQLVEEYIQANVNNTLDSTPLPPYPTKKEQ